MSRLGQNIMRYHVDWTKQFVIVTDASGYACGYALMQVDDNGHSQIVRTGSKTLNETQQRYSTTEKEAYGLVTLSRTVSTTSGDSHS